MARSGGYATNIPIDCASCRARIDGLCASCASAIQSVIAAYKANDRQIRAGQDIVKLGEPSNAIYHLVDGWVILYSLLEDGRRQILHFAMRGAMFGFDVGNSLGATYGVQALTDAIVCVIPNRALDLLLREHPEMGLRLAWLVSRDRNLAYDHLTSVGRRSAHERVAHLLLELFIRLRSQWPGHQIEEMYLPLTQEHIGDATGLTGVHVNRVLHELRYQGILEFRYRRLKILNPDKLVDIAGIDPQLAMSWISNRPLG